MTYTSFNPSYQGHPPWEISEQVTEHPSITQAEIVDAFDGTWSVPEIHPATYMITTGEVPAWLASVQRR